MMKRLFTLLFAASCLTAFGQVPDYVPTEGLVAWYALDGDAVDAASHDLHGEVFGAQGGVDRHGNQQGCLVFDGVNDFIQTELLPATGAQSRSFVFWAKTSTLHTQGDAAGMDILCFGGPDEVGKVNEVSLNHVCEGLSFDISSGVMTKQCDVTSGDWHFYALVVSSDGAGDVGFESVQFYQNGELLSEICSLGPYSTTINTGSSSPMIIGAYFNASIRFFDGSLDDLGVWDRALSAEEIDVLYSTIQPIQGCTDEAACNYNVDAILDDGTCDLFTCKCLEGTIWSEELGGCIVANPSDSNFDGCVQLNDLLDLLSAYGDCGAEETPWQCGDPLDYQGYEYETVQIGEQCWFAENLRAENYRNGESLGSTLMAWLSSTEEGQTVIYGADSEISCQDFSPDIPVCDSLETTFLEFGLLYNNHAVSDIRGVCPLNWHVSTDEDWMILESFLGIPEEELTETGFRGINQGQMIKTTYGWKGGGSGSDAVGFHGKPAGGFSPEIPNFNNAGSDANWWAPSDVNPLMRRNLNDYTSGIRRVDIIENAGISIRCIKDTE